MPGPTPISVPGRSDPPPVGWLPDIAVAEQQPQRQAAGVSQAVPGRPRGRGAQRGIREGRRSMLLEFVDVAKVYRGGVRGVDGVTMRLGAGLVGLLGPNGAGKSSLMRIAATVTRPTSGQVLFDGTDAVARPG